MPFQPLEAVSERRGLQRDKKAPGRDPYESQLPAGSEDGGDGDRQGSGDDDPADRGLLEGHDGEGAAPLGKKRDDGSSDGAGYGIPPLPALRNENLQQGRIDSFWLARVARGNRFSTFA